MNDLKNLPPGFFTAMMAMFAVIVLIIFLVYFLFVKNLRDTLNAVRPQNRLMPPSQVWLLLLMFLGVLTGVPGGIADLAAEGMYKGDLVVNPAMIKNMSIAESLVSIFIVIWNFRVVTKIADSIALEYASRNKPVEPRPTYQAGLIYCICSAVSLVISFLPALRWVGTVVNFAGFIFWVFYWLKTAGYKKALKDMAADPDEESALFGNVY